MHLLSEIEHLKQLIARQDSLILEVEELALIEIDSLQTVIDNAEAHP